MSSDSYRPPTSQYGFRCCFLSRSKQQVLHTPVLERTLRANICRASSVASEEIARLAQGVRKRAGRSSGRQKPPLEPQIARTPAPLLTDRDRLQFERRGHLTIRGLVSRQKIHDLARVSSQISLNLLAAIVCNPFLWTSCISAYAHDFAVPSPKAIKWYLSCK